MILHKRWTRIELGNSGRDIRLFRKTVLRGELFTSAVLGTASQNISILMSPIVVWSVTDMATAPQPHLGLGTKAYSSSNLPL